MQLPQLLTVRLAPQLSVPVTLPQFLASREQKAASLSGVQAATELKANQSRLNTVSSVMRTTRTPAVSAMLGTVTVV